MSDKKKRCMICAKPSENSICDSCKANVQGEAVEKKQRMEKQVRIGSEMEKERKRRPDTE